MNIEDLPLSVELEMEDGSYQGFEVLLVLPIEDRIYLALQEVVEENEPEADVILAVLNVEDRELSISLIEDEATFQEVLGEFANQIAKIYSHLDKLPVETEDGRKYLDLAGRRPQ